jgi:hypothetical protein
MNKKLAAAMVAVVVVGGGVAASLTVASAQTGTTTPSTLSTATKPEDRPDRGAAEKSALDPLVTDGTITQDQEDKVVAALKTVGPKGRGMGEEGEMGGLGEMGGFGAARDAVAQALGITTDQLKTDLKAGQSIADIATAQHVDVAQVIQVIVDQANTKVDAAVQAGKMTQAEADKIKSGETQMITDLVNGKMPFGGHGGHGHGHGPGHDGPPSAGDGDTTTPSLPSS